MEEEPAQPGFERRSSQRFTTRSLVEVRIPTWTALQAVYTVNLSLGGMRLSLGARTAMGAPVDIIMTLPDGERLHLPGKVAYLGPGESGDVGVRFDELTPTRSYKSRTTSRSWRPAARRRSGSGSRACRPASSSRKRRDRVARALRAWISAIVLAAVVSPSASVASPASDDDARVNAALMAALPADGVTDLMVIAQPSTPDAPRAWGATRVAASPASIKDVAARSRALHAR